MTMALRGLAVRTFTIAVCIASVQSLTFSAFNIKWLSPNEYSKPHVADALPKILDRYDITLIQELRSEGENVLSRIAADLLNRTGIVYSYVLSAKLGRTSYKEQYAYIWRTDRSFSVSNATQYPDTNDDFEREPFMILVRDPSLIVEEFTIIGAHIKPNVTLTQRELDKMIDVYDFAVATLGTPNVLFAGDFNADCRYLSNAKYDNLLLTTDTRFHWLIGKLNDTTVSSSDCSYDRFCATDAVKDGVVSGSVHIYDFEAALNLPHDIAYDVSDHYPIELTLRKKEASSVSTPASSSVSTPASSSVTSSACTCG